MVFFYNFWLFSLSYRNLKFILFLRKKRISACPLLLLEPLPIFIRDQWNLKIISSHGKTRCGRWKVPYMLYTVTEQLYFYTYETSPPSSGNPKRWHCRYVLLTLCIRGVQCASTPFSRNAPMPRSKL